MGRPKLTEAERKEAATRKASLQNERRKKARAAKGGENTAGVDANNESPFVDNEANYPTIEHLLNRMDAGKAENVRNALDKYRTGQRS